MQLQFLKVNKYSFSTVFYRCVYVSDNLALSSVVAYVNIEEVIGLSCILALRANAQILSEKKKKEKKITK